ncbi:MAG TPA: cation:proton antiporter, partial [Microbacteriaceae bacterium]|nr:cation:proton antiporter [Microbacteriaceae bacterium]
MNEHAMYWGIAALSAIVIVSYVFSIVSNKTRIPSVLMLLVLGIGLRQAVTATGTTAPVGSQTLQFLGVLGLIVILLEAGLDLTLSRKKAPLIRRAVLSSLILLATTTAGIAVILYVLFGHSLMRSIVYAVPLSVISSTIVASSIHYLAKDKREFLTYESALSDIFGILLFNFLIAGGSGAGLIAFDLASLVVAVAASVVVSIVLVFLLAKVNINIKAFLIFAVLLLIYAVGYASRLPTLLTVLIFGLIINNWRASSFRPFHRYLKPGDVEAAAETVKSVTGEAAFLIRTMFFVLFGYTID